MKKIANSFKFAFSKQSLKHAVGAGATGAGLGTTATPVNAPSLITNFLIGAVGYLLKNLLFGSSVKPSLNDKSNSI